MDGGVFGAWWARGLKCVNPLSATFNTNRVDSCRGRPLHHRSFVRMGWNDREDIIRGGCFQLESLPAGGGINTCVAPRAARNNRVAAIHHVPFADAERPQSVQVVALPGIVRPFRQRTHPWSYVVRHYKEREGRKEALGGRNGHVHVHVHVMRMIDSDRPIYCTQCFASNRDK